MNVFKTLITISITSIVLVSCNDNAGSNEHTKVTFEEFSRAVNNLPDNHPYTYMEIESEYHMAGETSQASIKAHLIDEKWIDSDGKQRSLICSNVIDFCNQIRTETVDTNEWEDVSYYINPLSITYTLPYKEVWYMIRHKTDYSFIWDDPYGLPTYYGIEYFDLDSEDACFVKRSAIYQI